MTLRKTVKDIGIIGISRVLTSLTGIILMPVLTKNLGAYGYGLWAQVGVTVSLSVMILRLGLPLSIKRLFPGKEIIEIRKDFYSIVIFVFLISTTFAVLLYLFPNILANAIFEGEIDIVRAVAIIIVVSSLDVIFLTTIRAFREMKKYAIINVASTYTFVGLAILLVLSGYGIWGPIFAMLIVKGSLSILLFIMLSTKLTFKKPDFSSLKEYLSFGIPAMPAGISHIIVDMSDRYIIGIFLGATFVGYYTPGYSLGLKFSLLISGILSMVLLPALSEYYENNNIKLVKRIIKLSLKFFLLISIPAAVGLIIVGKPILLLLTTPDIAQQSYIILVVSAFIGIMIGIYTIFKQVLFLKKKTKLITYYWGVCAAVNFAGNLILIPTMEILGAAISTVISYLLIVILISHFSYKNFEINVDFTAIIKIVLTTLLMGLTLYLIKIFIWSNPFFLIVLGIIIYFITLYFIGGFNKKEIRFLKTLY